MPDQTEKIQKPAQVDRGTKTISIPQPAYEPMTLPSRGKFYDPVIPDGLIHIRPMTVGEEKILTTPSLVKTGEAIDMIFKNCIKEKIDIDNLLAADKTAILFWLRAASYGRDYEISVKCPFCEYEFNRVIDLETDITVNFYDDSFTEPITVELPKAGTKAKVRLPRSRDEKFLSKRKTKKGRIDNALVERLNLLVVEIEGVEKEVKPIFIENMTAYDASLLKEAIAKDYFGIDTELNLVCDNCGEEFELEIPIGENFFRVYQAPK